MKVCVLCDPLKKRGTAYVCACMHVCMLVHVEAHVHFVSSHVQIQKCTMCVTCLSRLSVHVYTYAHAYICVHACDVCALTCTQVYACICAHTHYACTCAHTCRLCVCVRADDLLSSSGAFTTLHLLGQVLVLAPPGTLCR
jgi:hypothetical protein